MGIIVEGESDEDSIPHLIRGLAPGTVVIPRRTRGSGPLLDAKRLQGYVLEILERRAEKVLILRDCECTDQSQYDQASQLVVRQLSRAFPGIVFRYIFMVHELEAWLMGDRKAVEAVLGPEVARRLPANPESPCRPKKELERISGSRFDYMRDDPRIAQRSDVQAILAACPSFKEFKLALEDP